MVAIRSIKGFLFVLILAVTSTIFTPLFLGPTLILLWLKPRWFRFINDSLVTVWLSLPVVMLEYMLDVKIILTGEKPARYENSIIIMNHRCRLDWMFFWCVMARSGELALRNEKIMMKRELKYIPGPGWAMQNALYIFLYRRWEKDESYLNSLLRYFVSSPDKLHLLMFPEGTNFEEITKTWSDNYAKKNDLPLYDYVLHPRVRGFTHCVEKLRQGNKIDAIYDVTVGYSENYCFEELDIIKGKIPDEIHFHIQRFSIDELPVDSQGLHHWCSKRWSEKEERLSKFYSQDEKHFTPVVESVIVDNNEEEAVRVFYKFELVFWVLSSSCVCLLLATSSLLRWCLLFFGIVFFVLTLCGGTDKIFLNAQTAPLDASES